MTRGVELTLGGLGKVCSGDGGSIGDTLEASGEGIEDGVRAEAVFVEPSGARPRRGSDTFGVPLKTTKGKSQQMGS